MFLRSIFLLSFIFCFESGAADLKSAPVLSSTAGSIDPYQILDLRHGNTYASDDLLLTSGPATTTHLSRFTGNNIILYFWDLKCPDCEKQWKEMMELNKAASQEGVRFLNIFAGDPDEGLKAHQFVSDHKGSNHYWIAAPGFSRDQFISNGLPTAFFLSSDNQIIAIATGRRDWSAHKNLAFLIRKIYSD